MHRVAPAVAVCLACVCAATAHGHVISSLTLHPTAIVVNVPIAIVGADPVILEKWTRAIDDVWNKGNDGGPFVVCGRDVRFNPRFTPRDEPRPLPDAHLVVVRPVAPGEHYVSSVWHALGTSPSYSARTGFWGSTMDGETAAHEFGHLVGLLDEYVEKDINGNGMREPGERPVPNLDRYPDGWFSLMAGDRGVVLARHVFEVLRLHGGTELLTCAAGN